MKKRLWLRITFPNGIPFDDRCPNGPFYAPGASWYYFPKERAWAEQIAEAQRAKGREVMVSEEWR